MKNYNLIEWLWKTDSHEKQTPQRFGRYAAMLILLLTLGVGQMWADSTVKGGNIYFDELNSGYTGAGDMQFWAGHSSYSSSYSMSKITNTKLWYCSAPSWNDATYFAFTSGCNGWGGASQKYYDRIGSSTWKSAIKESYTINSGNFYVFKVASTANKAAVNSSSPYGHQGTAYSSLNKSQTFKVQVSTDGGSTYSNPATAPATISFSSNTFSNANTCGTSSTGSFTAGGSTVSLSRNAGYTATTTLTYSSMSSSYTFVCWHDGSESVGTGTSYEYYPTSAKTITARFTKNFTVGDKIYLLRNTTWKNASGLNHYAAYFYGAEGNTWVNCEQVGTSDYYSVTVPSGNWGYVIFVALNNATNNWSYKIYQTNDLMYDAAHNGVEITGSDKSQSRMTVYTGISVSRTPLAAASAPTITNSQTVVKSGSSVTINAQSETTGYHWVNWTKTSGTLGNASNKTTTFTPSANSASAVANYALNTYTVSYNANDAQYPGTASGSTTSSAHTYGTAKALTSNGFTRAGYNFAGWATSPTGAVVYTDGESVTNLTNDNGVTIPLYAKWTAKQSAITFDYQTEVTGYYSSGSISNATGLKGTYNSAMTALTGTMPSAIDGYAFTGFYDATSDGTKYYNADGTSAHTWDKDTESGTTLYARWEKAAVTDISFSPAAVVAPNTTITATPTISPTPTGTHIVCWEVQYSNGTALPSQPTFTPGASNSVSFSAPSASATYRLQATLRTGSSCEGGSELSVYSTTFQVAGEHEVTVRYQDESGRTLKDTIHITGKPLEWTTLGDITPPTITGYKFDHWDAGDGVTIKNGDSDPVTTTTTSSIQIKAVYDGTLTAVYAKKKLIFFNNTLGWSDVYVYFYNSDKYWNDAFGSGAKQTQAFDGDKKPYWEQEHGHMTQIEGTNIWYFDYEGAGYATRANVAFTEGNQHGYQWFNYTKAVVRGDHGSSLQMFVPLTTKTTSKNNTDYYNHGYWMNYPENTGYSLLIYNQKAKYGATKLYEIPFEFTEDYTMPMELTVDLEAGQTYGFEIKRADGTYYSTTTTITANTSNWGLYKNQTSYCGLQTTAAGDYTFSLFYDGEYRVGVTYPVAVNDYRIVYTDLATWSKTAHTASWNHPSRVITKNSSATETKKDTVSFFWSYGSSPAIKYQQCTATGTGSVTWNAGTAINVSSFSSVLTKSGVYNFIFEQPAGGASISLVKVEPYAGKYYIRTDCAGSSKWTNYRSTDHEMTYSEYTEKNHGYSHYFPHWVLTGQNVKFVIANDFSPCISDTLVEDKGTVVANITTEGNANAGRLNSGDASIRFMWDYKTNKVSRAYISGSTNVSDRFLVLEGDAKMYDENGDALSISGLNANEINLVDDQNFVYERTIKVNTGARAKLTAKYNNNVQYFRGSEGAFADGTTVQLLGGDAAGKHTMRIVYDFKTNRLVTAYVPSGTINEDIAINADLMIVREHQDAGQQLLFNGGSLSEVKTVYGVMCFNRWTLNNKEKTGGHSPVGDPKSAYERALYWISFPFDVNLSDVFGFGTYGTHWIIMEYDGAERAKEGYWRDSEGFWKHVTNRTGKVLKAGKGYVLGLDLDLMKDDNTSFWSNNIEQVELFFPSADVVSNISSTNVTTTVEEHECKIDRTGNNGSDINKNRTRADSHWNIIGIPSYANYGTTLEDGSGNTINWHTSPYTNDLPFLYEWSTVDNTYSVQSGTTYPFKSMHAYMVQYHGDLYWSMASATPPSIVARRTYAERPQNVEMRLELLQNEQKADQTFVKLSNDENVSANFAFDEDLCKEYNANKANIYTIVENYLPVAGNTLPMSDQTTIVPVGVKIAATGDYTFAIPDGTSGVGVTLVDTETGIRTSLSALDYTINLAAGTYDNRFLLEISPIVQTPTDIENVQGDNVQGTKVRKVMVDGILYIVKDGQVFDAQGRLVK